MSKAKYSFEEWCNDNNRKDILERWDCQLNDEIPRNISFKSNKKYWFLCPCGKHDSELKNIQYLSMGRQTNLLCNKCESFAQYVIDNFGNEYFDNIISEDNTLSPWELKKSSSKKLLFNCIDCGHDYETSCNHFINGSRCSYCSHQKTNIDNSLGVIYPISFDIWSDKNCSTPYMYYPKSSVSVWWKCENGLHEDYQRKIYSTTNKNFKCPKCVQIENGRKRRIDITNQKFNMLTALYIDEEKSNSSSRTHWVFQCDCGTKKSINITKVMSGEIKACGCMEHAKGEFSKGWKGGLVAERQLARNTKEYKDWRNEVYKKDWYTCQCCGSYKNIIKNAHHILSFANNENLRYDVNNGITLCKQCHYTTEKDSFHNKYGTNDNTPQQLEEYINYKRNKLGIHIPFSISMYLDGNILKPDSNMENMEEQYGKNKNLCSM